MAKRVSQPIDAAPETFATARPVPGEAFVIRPSAELFDRGGAVLAGDEQPG